jgi:hypothetical protein
MSQIECFCLPNPVGVNTAHWPSFRLKSRVPLDPAGLAHYLSPELFSLHTGSTVIFIEINSAPLAALKMIRRGTNGPSSACCEVFPGVQVTIRNDSLRRIVAHNEDQFLFIVEYNSQNDTLPSSLAIMVPEENATISAESLVLRVYRDVLRHVLRRAGFVLVHASAVAKHQRGLLFLGDKGSGKSAWLLRALSHGWDLLANDRAFVHPESLSLVAFPIAAMLNPASVLHLPHDLRSRISENRIRRHDRKSGLTQKLGLTPRELAESMGVRFLSAASVEQVFVLWQRSAGEAAVKSAPIPTQPEITSVIARNIYEPTDPTYVFDLFTRNDRTCSLPDDDACRNALTRRSKILEFDWPEFDSQFSEKFPECFSPS